jgi:alpha-N-acetylglucosamine transferase
MKYSSFEQVFFLDNDVVPLKSMDFMFFTPQFSKHGAIFWADALPAQPGFPWGLEVAEAIGVDWSHPVPDDYQQYLSPLCSAQIMVDKGKFWQELSLATYLNLDTTLYYRVMHGDKDIFAAAWMVSWVVP